MNARPEPPPEATLIKSALKRRRTSARAAAKLAGISDARWRQITSGYQSVSGTYIPVKAPDDTLARMARVAGLSPADLAEAGREGAATELEALGPLPAGPTAHTGYASDPHIEAIASVLSTLPPEAQDEVLRKIGRG